MLNLFNQEAQYIESMIYGNLPNQINNVSFLGTVRKEVELRVRAEATPNRTEVLVWCVFFMGRGGNVETGRKWFLVHY